MVSVAQGIRDYCNAQVQIPALASSIAEYYSSKAQKIQQFVVSSQDDGVSRAAPSYMNSFITTLDEAGNLVSKTVLLSSDVISSLQEGDLYDQIEVYGSTLNEKITVLKKDVLEGLGEDYEAASYKAALYGQMAISALDDQIDFPKIATSLQTKLGRLNIPTLVSDMEAVISGCTFSEYLSTLAKTAKDYLTKEPDGLTQLPEFNPNQYTNTNAWIGGLTEIFDTIESAFSKVWQGWRKLDGLLDRLITAGKNLVVNISNKFFSNLMQDYVVDTSSKNGIVDIPIFSATIRANQIADGVMKGAYSEHMTWTSDYNFLPFLQTLYANLVIDRCISFFWYGYYVILAPSDDGVSSSFSVIVYATNYVIAPDLVDPHVTNAFPDNSNGLSNDEVAKRLYNFGDDLQTIVGYASLFPVTDYGIVGPASSLFTSTTGSTPAQVIANIKYKNLTTIDSVDGTLRKWLIGMFWNAMLCYDNTKDLVLSNIGYRGNAGDVVNELGDMSIAKYTYFPYYKHADVSKPFLHAQTDQERFAETSKFIIGIIVAAVALVLTTKLIQLKVTSKRRNAISDALVKEASKNYVNSSTPENLAALKQALRKQRRTNLINKLVGFSPSEVTDFSVRDSDIENVDILKIIQG